MIDLLTREAAHRGRAFNSAVDVMQESGILAPHALASLWNLLPENDVVGQALACQAVASAYGRPGSKDTAAVPQEHTVPICAECGLDAEDAGDHADMLGHWPRLSVKIPTKMF